VSDYLTNLIGQQRPKNTVPVPTQTQGPYVPPFPAKPKFKLLPDSPQDALRELGENFGVVGRGLTQGVAAPVTMIADPLTDFINQVLPKGYKQTRPGEAIGQGLDVAGVPRATTDAQKVLEAGTSGLAGGGAIAKTAQLAGKGAGLAKGYLDTIGKDLAGQMTSGLGSGAGSVGATQAATASGASPVVAQLAGIGGGIVGGGARPVGGAKEINTIPPKGAYISYGKNADPFLDSEDIESYGPEYWLIEKLFVPEEYRGTGVGSAMVKNAIHEMIKEDASKPIRLSADPFGKNAMSHQELADWYKKLGFDEETYTEGMSGVPMRYYGKDPGLQNIPSGAKSIDPILAFHGSKYGIDEINPEKGYIGPTFFTDSKEIANKYGKGMTPTGKNNNFEENVGSFANKTITANLNIKKPITKHTTLEDVLGNEEAEDIRTKLDDQEIRLDAQPFSSSMDDDSDMSILAHLYAQFPYYKKLIQKSGSDGWIFKDLESGGTTIVPMRWDQVSLQKNNK
jgi:GNAT superfamily N-acetyltransferase